MVSLELEQFKRNIFRFTTKTEQLVNEELTLVQEVGKNSSVSIIVSAFKAHNKNVTTINNLEPFLTPEHKPF